MSAAQHRGIAVVAAQKEVARHVAIAALQVEKRQRDILQIAAVDRGVEVGEPAVQLINVLGPAAVNRVDADRAGEDHRQAAGQG